MADGSIRFNLLLNYSQFKEGLNDAEKSLLKWRDQTNNSSKEMLKWGAAIGATIAPLAAAGAVAYSEVQKFGALADQIRDLSYTTGLTTKKIQELKYAATLSGTEFSTVTTGINQFTLAIAGASEAGSEANKAFSTLGVTTSGRTVDQIFEDTAHALVNMKDETRRNEIATTLYGRSWKEMLPYMQTYIEKSKEIKENPYLTDEDLNNLEEAKNALDALSSKLTTFEGKVIGAYLKFETIRSKSYGGLFDFLTGKKIEDTPFDAFADAKTQSANTTQTQEIISLTDKYTGLTDTEIELIQTTDLLTAAEDERAKVTNQIDYDKLSAKIQGYKNRIVELKNSLSDLNKTTASTNAQVASSVMGSHYDPTEFYKAGGSEEQWKLSGSGESEMYKFIQRERALGTSDQDALNNWAAGTPTQGTVETGESSTTETTTPGTPEQTKTVQTEYTTQAKALQGLTNTVADEYQKQTDAFRTHLDALAELRATQYPVLETQDLTHWATSEEIAKTAIQKELDFMATAVNFGGTNPIVQNYIVMSENGPDWTPPAFKAVTAPRLESADFTAVGAAVQGIVAKGLGGGTSGSVTINQTNNIVTPDSDKAANKVAKATSKILAGVNGVGGQL